MGMSKFGVWREFQNPQAAFGAQQDGNLGNSNPAGKPQAGKPEEENMSQTAEAIVNFLSTRMRGKSISGSYDDVQNLIARIAQEVMSHATATKGQGKLPMKNAVALARALSKPAQTAGM